MEVLGIDIGGSGIKGAPVDITTGKLLAERVRIETPAKSDPENLAKSVGQIASAFNWSGLIGIGFPAVVRHGVVQTASNIDKSWINFPGQSYFSNFLNLPVYFVNDADAAGLAEVNYGNSLQNEQLVLLITAGTGIGSAVMLNKQLMPNTELGHLEFKGIKAEHYASDAVRKRLKLSRYEWALRFNEYLLYLEFLFSPDLFIIGGGASKKFDKFKEVITTKTRVVPASLLNDAGIIGAARFAWENHM